MASILPAPKIQFIDGNGEAIVNGKIYTYEAGTSTPQETWLDFNKTQLNTNPVILDDEGRASIWIDGWYKIVVRDANNELIYTMDNISSVSDINLEGLTATIDDLNSTSTIAINVSSNYDVLTDDRGKNILVNAVSTPIDINLISAVTAGDKYKVTIKKVDKSSNQVLIKTDENETIDDIEDIFYLDSYNDFVELLSDGSNWEIVASQFRGASEDYDEHTVPLNISLGDNGKTILLDATSGSMSVNLPSVVDVGSGFLVDFKKVDDSENIITINPVIGQKIDGADELELDVFNEGYGLKASNVGWNIVAYISATTSFSTGDVKATYKSSEAGWILMNDGTIGNSTSGADFASTKAKNLYVLLYNAIDDTWCPVDGGRTGNALNDFNAGKTMELPKQLGRALCVAGASADLTPRILGHYLGEEENQLTLDTLPSHRHNINLYKVGDLPATGNHEGYRGSNVGDVQTKSTLYVGGNEKHNNMQPSFFINHLIKL